VTLEYIQKKPYFGSSEVPVRIRELMKVKGLVDSTVSYGEKRLVFSGNLVVDHVKGSWRWGEEVAINLWTRDLPRFENRAENDGYSRVAISLDLRTALGLCQRWLEKLWSLGV